MTARHFSLLKRIWIEMVDWWEDLTLYAYVLPIILKRIWIEMVDWWEDLPLYAYVLLIILAITVVWLLLVRLFGLGLWCIAYCLVVLIALG